MKLSKPCWNDFTCLEVWSISTVSTNLYDHVTGSTYNLYDQVTSWSGKCNFCHGKWFAQYRELKNTSNRRRTTNKRDLHVHDETPPNTGKTFKSFGLLYGWSWTSRVQSGLLIARPTVVLLSLSFLLLCVNFCVFTFTFFFLCFKIRICSPFIPAYRSLF